MPCSKSYLTALTGVLLGLLLSGSAMALDAGISCKLPNCATVSLAPRTILTAIDPEPLPAVDPGDAQTVSAKWTVQLGLRSAYELCLTTDSNTAPRASDDCVVLSDRNATPGPNRSTNFEDTVTLPGSLYRAAAEFYVRTTNLIHLTGHPPASWNSNTLDFQWPLRLPNLSAHGAKPSQVGSSVFAEVTVRNRSGLDAGMFGTRFEVAVCDALGELEIRDPEEEPLRYICKRTTPAYLTGFQLKGPYQSGLLAGAAVNVFTDIGGMLPAGPGTPSMLFITVTATVDHDNDVAESREDDNADNGSRFITP